MQFDENGTRIQNDVFIQQYRRDNVNSSNLSRVSFGIIRARENNTFVYVNEENSSSVWPGMYNRILLLSVFITNCCIQMASQVMEHQ